MRNLLVLAAGAPLLLIGAAYPEESETAAAAVAAAAASPEVATSYRPCRPGPGDDRCIQLYERGVRAAYARWQRAHAERPAAHAAVGGPTEHRAHRPRARHRDARPIDHHRCAAPEAPIDGEARG